MKRVRVYKNTLQNILKSHNTDAANISRKLGYGGNHISAMFHEYGGTYADMPVPLVITMSHVLAVKFDDFLEIPMGEDGSMIDETIKRFIDSCLVIDKKSYPKPRIERGELYRRYECFCDDENICAYSRNRFYDSIRVKGFREIRLSHGSYFEGIMLRDRDEEKPQIPECDAEEELKDLIRTGFQMLHADLRALLAEWKPKEPKEPKYAIKEREQP